VELRDRIGSAEALEAAADGGGAGGGSPAARDAVTALAALGYKPDAARKMVGDAMRRAEEKDWTAEELIRRSLRK
ncbi:MAG: Holliday junction branch migration protein RuvA, partial [Lentisphaerae bacterium]|nr:Holliday junction branch migration protein RuvA [Lentisphaerota bacterium]